MFSGDLCDRNTTIDYELNIAESLEIFLFGIGHVIKVYGSEVDLTNNHYRIQ